MLLMMYMSVVSVDSIEDARNRIQDLRRSNQPLNIYCYDAFIQGSCQEDRPDEAFL
jgi:pentatricopeptide repeat domain-containing protein 1/leucine-rich PPR motif-containing protein